jgi:hypothetical protein
MTGSPSQSRPAPRPATVRRIMAKHGLPEPSARLLALMAYGEAANG